MYPDPENRAKKAEDKTRAELIVELKKLKDINARLRTVVKRYERVAGKRDLYSSLYDIEADKDSLETLRYELREKRKEVDFQSEELEVADEEVRVQLEELNSGVDKLARANEALLASESRYRAIFEQSAVGLTNVGKDGHYLRVNQKYCDITGYSRDELSRMRVHDLTYPPDITEELQLVERLLAGEIATFTREKRYVRKNGDLIWIRLTVTPIHNNGKIEYLMGISEDITERKQAEDTIAADMRDTELLRGLSARLIAKGDGNVLYQEIIGAAMAIMHSDFASLQMLHPERGSGGELHLLAYRGFSPQAAQFWEWVGTDSAGSTCGAALRKGERVLVSDVEKCEYMQGTEDLKMFRQVGIRSCQTTPLFSRTGKLVGMISTHWSCPHIFSEHELRLLDLLARQAADLIERKLADKALQESEEQYRGLFESSVDGIATTDMAGNVTKVNTAYRNMLGYSEEELKHLNYKQITPARWHDMEEQIIREQVISRGYSDEYEKEYIRKDGSIFPISIRIWLIKDQQGRSIGMWAIVSDITERKRAEDELKVAKQQAELYLDLMGHDISNMHQIALGYLELAREMQDESGTVLLDKPIEVLQRSARLISNVRKMQKLHNGEFSFEPVDVTKVLFDVQREFGALPNKKIRLSLDGSEHYMVRGNELLQDVFANLVSNAIKHTGEKTDIAIHLDSVKDDGRCYCRVAVEDNGPGIPDDFKGKVFNRILKGTTNAKGSGIGLFLVKSLVESYGGRIWVENRVPGDHTKGCRFIVELPAVDAP